MEIFRRVENKYICTEAQKKQFLDLCLTHMHEDTFYQYTVHTVYLDNENNAFIISSLDHPVYKVKMRLRSYEDVTDNSIVYLELKKKMNDIVYKSRISLNMSQAEQYLNHQAKLSLTDCTASEFDYLMKYTCPVPKVLLLYERECYAADTETDIRITFDNHLRYRLDHIFLNENGSETELISDQYLLEIKAEKRYPLWLVHALEECHIHKQSFSKYGNVYIQNFNTFNHKGGSYA